MTKSNNHKIDEGNKTRKQRDIWFWIKEWRKRKKKKRNKEGGSIWVVCPTRIQSHIFQFAKLVLSRRSLKIHLSSKITTASQFQKYDQLSKGLTTIQHKFQPPFSSPKHWTFFHSFPMYNERQQWIHSKSRNSYASSTPPLWY